MTWGIWKVNTSRQIGEEDQNSKYHGTRSEVTMPFSSGVLLPAPYSRQPHTRSGHWYRPRASGEAPSSFRLQHGRGLLMLRESGENPPFFPVLFLPFLRSSIPPLQWWKPSRGPQAPKTLTKGKLTLWSVAVTVRRWGEPLVSIFCLSPTSQP